MIIDVFEQRLRAGSLTVAEVVARSAREGGFDLRHRGDIGIPTGELTVFQSAEKAREIARFDANGAYRPLKAAPTLMRGWCLRLDSPREALLALDYFYPGAFASWIRFCEGQVTPVPLRETAGRQSGMYRITQKVSDDQANELVGRFCNSSAGCLRTILWTIETGRPIRSLPGSKFNPASDQAGERTDVIPFLCVEACNLLVAELRKVVKAAKR